MPEDYAFDEEAYFDEALTVRRQGNFNYLAATHVYLLSLAGNDISWVGDPLDFDFSRLSAGYGRTKRPSTLVIFSPVDCRSLAQASIAPRISWLS
jgi:hypothetical protein